MQKLRYYFVKSIKDYLKYIEKKGGLKNIFFKKIDNNFLRLSKDEQLQIIINVLKEQGFKIKK